MDFGNAVRHRRRELGLSQEELAWRAGLNRTYVTDVERGARNLSLATVEKLARALEKPLHAILQEIELNRGVTSGVDPELLAPVEILLVEDNPHDAELAVRALRRARLANQVHLVRDGAEALDHLFCVGRQSDESAPIRFQLVLLDLKLPHVSGLDVLRRVKSSPLTREIPVVVLTSSSECTDVAECRRLGVAAFIAKPVDFQRLSEVTPALDLAWTLVHSPGR